jgi:hypothetical protein
MNTGKRLSLANETRSGRCQLTFDQSTFLLKRTSILDFPVQPEDGVETRRVELEVAVVNERDVSAKHSGDFGNENAKFAGSLQRSKLVRGIILKYGP